MFVIVGALLYYLDVFQMKRAVQEELPFALWTIIILGFLLAGVLALLNRECQKITRKIERYEHEIREADKALKQAQADFNETVERRTFEISVINASLNREIAERMQAEAEEKKVERRMSLILESAGEGIFGLDSDGNVTFTNKAASKMLGWTPEELVGKSHHNLVHHTHTDGTVYEVKECPIHMAYKDGKVHYMDDDVFWTKDGNFFHVEYVSTPILENNRLVGAVIVFSDITKRLEADRESRRLQRRLELILNSAGEGIFGLDSDGNVTFTNKAASKMLGWTPEELVGKSHHNLVHHTHTDGTVYDVKDCPIHMAYKDGKIHYMDDDVFWTKDGNFFHVEYVSTPILENDRLAGAVIVFSDITNRLKADRESRRLQRRLELILNSAGEGIFGLDSDGNVTFTNKAASEMLGWTPEELVGRSHHNLVHHTHTDGTVYEVEDCPIYMAYKDGQVHFQSNDVFWRKDGTSFPVEYVSTPILEKGVLAGAVVVFNDLSHPFSERGYHVGNAD